MRVWKHPIVHLNSADLWDKKTLEIRTVAAIVAKFDETTPDAVTYGLQVADYGGDPPS